MEFITRRRVLKDVERDLIRSLGGDAINLPIDIYLGLHIQNVSRRDGRLTVGIQTEHFGLSDDWITTEYSNGGVFRGNIALCDYVIDYTERNSTHYKEMGVSIDGRFLFGPYVFPSTAPSPSPANNNKAIFIGTFRDAPHLDVRMKKIEKYREKINLTAASGLYREGLDEKLKEYSFMANIHRLDGTYTEVPRFLKSFLNGMILISEELDSPFICGRHYSCINGSMPSREESEEILKNIHHDFSNYRFAKIINEIYSDWRK